jgi:hydrogenase expression/formation protein HypE
MAMKRMPVGKLSSIYLGELLRKHCRADARVVVGARVGEDAAVIDLGTSFLVAASDPITFASDAIGYYAVQINANDLATMGAEPQWFLATLLLPEKHTTKALVGDLFGQLSEACQNVNISWIGGHTEITSGLDRPIVVGTMLGQVSKDRLVTSSGARAGDVVILTKGIAVEGTALMAREKESKLKAKYSKEFLKRCKAFLYRPGIGIIQDARAATRVARVHAMHDPTEGGLATGLRELAVASQVGLRVNRSSISILPETVRLCQEFDLDPLGVIASGALLIVTSCDDSERVLDALSKADIAASIIARVTEQPGVCWEDGSSLPQFDRDEVARLFEGL